MNIREADGIAHLIQKCRDDPKMSYDKCATYLKECSALIDKSTRAKPPRQLMHVAENMTLTVNLKHLPNLMMKFASFFIP